MIELLFLVLCVFLVVRHRLYWKNTDDSIFGDEEIVFMAHRGHPFDTPENTLGSFEEAVTKGFRWIELDIVTTRDGIIVCSHNYDLERETNGKGWIKDIDSSELDYVRTGIYTHPENTRPLPRLKTVVQKLPDSLCYNFEIKIFRLFDISVVRPLVALIKEEKIKNYIVSSFNPLIIAFINIFYPYIKTAFLLEERKYLWLTHWIHPNCLHPRVDMIDDELINMTIDRNIDLTVWTVNNRQSIDWCKKHNIKGVITDTDVYNINYK